MAIVRIKNMVCPRCEMAVEQILQRLDLPFQEVRIGEVQTSRDYEEAELVQLDQELQAIGFEILKDRKEQLVEDIKIALLGLVNSEDTNVLKTSQFLMDRFNMDYAYLSNTFSEIQGESIEKYLIHLRVEKVKELLHYDMPLSEIAFKLQYSSVAHLSTQFKKITGKTPSEFKKLLEERHRS